MLTLNVPFLPDPDYVAFLDDLGARIHAVHFSLFESTLNDARIRFEEIEDDVLIEQLTSLPKTRKYLLANGRFQQMPTYTGDEGLQLVRKLERLMEAGGVDGIVFADSYFLRFLGDTAPNVAAGLEAIPSVNFIIDEVEKVTSLFEFVASCGFKFPGKISLDRSLNRNPKRLENLSMKLRNRWPEVKIELLVNEGCMPHCPFRATHEALIAAANTAAGEGPYIDTQRLNRELACQRFFLEEPHRIFSSPFIRPEDAHLYENSADLLKICGRTLGAEFLQRTVKAYIHGGYSGNLLDLLDASHWMADHFHIENGALPSDFPEILSACQGDCTRCDSCRNLFRSYASAKPLQLQDWRSE